MSKNISSYFTSGPRASGSRAQQPEQRKLVLKVEPEPRRLVPANVNEFLSGLKKEQARELLRVSTSLTHGFVYEIQMTGAEQGLVRTLNAVPREGGNVRNGQWYLAWAQCHLSKLKAEGNHPRWQPRILDEKTRRTPATLSSVGKSIKEALVKKGFLGVWLDLKHIAEKSSKGQIKIPLHHLAFKSGDENETVLTNMGTGSSISHLCDKWGCIRVEHLEHCVEHIDNLARQRCTGVTLFCVAGQIAAECPCEHGVGDDIESQIERSCRKLRVFQFSDDQARSLLSSLQTHFAPPP